ncbi:MAG TPA: hypothetical protein VF139_05320 [Candidatus Polarisedimenticolaceae bacterium]|jgi:hypothetical protein
MSQRNPALLTFVSALALLGSACSGTDSVTGGSSGNVRITLASATQAATLASGTSGGMTTLDDDHDDAGRSITAAAVTFSSILARNLAGELVPIASALPVTIDLKSVLEGRQVDLPAGTLPPGSYDQLVVVMTRVELTLTDGTHIAITPPGGGWTAIVPTAPFSVVEGGITTLELRLRGDVFDVIDGDFEFDPEFDCSRRD